MGLRQLNGGMGVLSRAHIQAGRRDYVCWLRCVLVEVCFPVASSPCFREWATRWPVGLLLGVLGMLEGDALKQ